MPKLELPLTFSHLVLSTLPAILYLLVESWIWGGNTAVLGSSVWFFTLFAIEVVKSARSNPYFVVQTYKIPTWSTPLIAALVTSFILPGSSLLGHLSALATGYLFAFGYLSLLSPSDRILRWIENKILEYGRPPYYISVDQKAYGRGGVLPMASSAEEGGIDIGFHGQGQRLGT
jgi:hypothetical protein